MKLLLALSRPVVTMCTTCFNDQELCILLTECIYGFRMILTVNRDHFFNPLKTNGNDMSHQL
jgi:hypothetical protein